MITRRRFIKLTSTAAAGAVLVGWAPKRAGRYPLWGRGSWWSEAGPLPMASR